MPLNSLQLAQFKRDGYLHLRGLLPPAMVVEARRVINGAMGRGMDPALMTQYSAQSFFPELRSHPALVGLTHQPTVLAVLDQLIGEGRYKRPEGLQIALRFPADGDPPAEVRWHLDGFHTPTNGVPKAQIHSFTALLGIFLSDTPEEWSGQLTVWPGGHLRAAEAFARVGPVALEKGEQPRFDPGTPLQTRVQAGDVVLAHYLLPHGIAKNLSPNIRYGMFARVQHVNRLEQRWEALCDPWLHWDAFREETAVTAQ